jgi:hypothetical protein
LGLRDDAQTSEAELKRIAEAVVTDPGDQEQFDFARDAIALWCDQLAIAPGVALFGHDVPEAYDL